MYVMPSTHSTRICMYVCNLRIGEKQAIKDYVQRTKLRFIDIIYLHENEDWRKTCFLSTWIPPPRSGAGINPFFKRDVVPEEITGPCAYVESIPALFDCLFVCLFVRGRR